MQKSVAIQSQKRLPGKFPLHHSMEFSSPITYGFGESTSIITLSSGHFFNLRDTSKIALCAFPGNRGSRHRQDVILRYYLASLILAKKKSRTGTLDVT